MKISYNRNSMTAAVKFLHANNPASRCYSELDLVRRIEESMMDCVNDDYMMAGTMGYTVSKDDWSSESVHFSISVDAGVSLPYEIVTISR